MVRGAVKLVKLSVVSLDLGVKFVAAESRDLEVDSAELDNVLNSYWVAVSLGKEVL